MSWRFWINGISADWKMSALPHGTRLRREEEEEPVEAAPAAAASDGVVRSPHRKESSGLNSI